MTSKIKIAFHFNRSGCKNVDLRFPELGNPGVGGTQFTTIATAYYLQKYHADLIEPILLTSSTELLPPALPAHIASNCVDALAKSESLGCDIFVFKSRNSNDPIYQHLAKTKVKAIARSNNTPDFGGLTAIAQCEAIKAHVCVGHEQLDLLRDRPIFAKSTRIFDLFNGDNFAPQKAIDKQSNTVVFIGNIIHPKGFHHLARVWPEIVKQKPDAKLIVIGSGKLYNRNSKLGAWQIAEEEYESTYIRPFLGDEKGNPMPSVNFIGLLGLEKIEVLQNADLGVVNPSGFTEVCPGSALEIQACGTPVVSGAKWGLLDTVINGKTGLLGHNDRDLIKNIVYLLDNPTTAKEMGKNGIEFVDRNFSPQKICQQWLDLFTRVDRGLSPQQQSIKSNYLYRGKILKEGMRIFKKNVPLMENIPPLSSLRRLKSK